MENLAKGRWSDPERVQELAKTYSQRYGDFFWEELSKMLPDNKYDVIGDFGCGPGIWLADAANRLSASFVIGLDASMAMLEYAHEVITQMAPMVESRLINVNFDTDTIPLKSRFLDLVFGGYLLHEVANADRFLDSVSMFVRSKGVIVIFDFISGNEDGFIEQMMKQGMSEERARIRYPHMCKHSLGGIEQKISSSGFSIHLSAKIHDILGIIVGIKEESVR